MYAREVKSVELRRAAEGLCDRFGTFRVQAIDAAAQW
jgi:hypothetical protein